ncbi:unnamed protein product, partial [Meganyctiphanes norvegica]
HRMQSTWWVCRVVVVVVAAMLVALAASGQAQPLAKRDLNEILNTKPKRPFCNAFTGCGKKRSDPAMDRLEEAASGAELDAIARHVLAEAKLWEQLQEQLDKRMDAERAVEASSSSLYRRKRSAVLDSLAQPKTLKHIQKVSTSAH